ncbi:Cytokinin dehydrogenase [Orobanche gracilis]
MHLVFLVITNSPMSSPSTIPPEIFLFLFVICIILTNPVGSRAASDSFKNRLHNDTHAIVVTSTDYGNIVHNKSSYIMNPAWVHDIINIIILSKNTTIVARGNGHSIRGQATTIGGVVVNMTALSKSDGSRIKVVTNSWLGPYAAVGGEQLWVDVLRATLKYGLAPVSWTDYLYLTVGGTLSNAGISGQAFKHGPQISNVLQLDVVTGGSSTQKSPVHRPFDEKMLNDARKGSQVGGVGKGQNIICSRRTNSELFFGVLGGLGQFGIINGAKIVLGKAPTRVKSVRLLYSNFSTFTRDQEFLISSNGTSPSYVEGFLIVSESMINTLFSYSSPPINQSNIVALLKNHSILYTIELAMYYDNQTANTIDKEFQTLLHKLNFIPDLNFNGDVTFFDFLNRVGNLDNPETGSTMSHPWLNLFIPKSRIVDFNRKVLATMLPRLNKTTGVFIFYPMNKIKWDDRMSAVIPKDGDQNIFYALALLHSTPRGEYKSMDGFNKEVLQVCKNAGINVKQYLPHYTNMGDWITHFGSKWRTFSQRKKIFDPKFILSPGQRIFN